MKDQGKRIVVFIVLAMVAVLVMMLLRPKSKSTASSTAITAEHVAGADASADAGVAIDIDETPDLKTARYMAVTVGQMTLTEEEKTKAHEIMLARNSEMWGVQRNVPEPSDKVAVETRRNRTRTIDKEGREKLDALLGPARSKQFTQIYYRAMGFGVGAAPKGLALWPPATPP